MTRARLKQGRAVAAGLVLAALPGMAVAAAEYASFESFYRQSPQFGWYLAAAFAIVAAAAVFIFAAPAGAAATAVGSWIGGMFGYTGIAATNFGLALLGGGAVAAGGLGIAGGVAVLAAAFSFSTDIVMNYAAGSLIETYQYQKFSVASQNMTTLPLPRNSEGPVSYESAMKVLEGVNDKEALSSSANRAVVRKAIATMNAVQDVKLTKGDLARKQSMLSLLLFVANDYRGAKDQALVAYRSSESADVTRTLPAFILATTLLYDEQVDFPRTIELFRYAIRGESENPLTPLLFSVFLDRMMYRFNDGTLATRQLSEVAALGDSPGVGDQWVPVQVVVFSRYVLLLKAEQQRISSLVLLGASNSDIRDSEKTLGRVQRSLEEYDRLLEGAQFLAGGLSSPKALTDKASTEQVRKLRSLLVSYSRDRARLANLVRTLEMRQSQHKRMSEQIEALKGSLGQLDSEGKSIRSIAISTNAGFRDSPETLAKVEGSLRNYEVLLDRAQQMAGALSSPQALPDTQSSEDVITVKTEVKSYVSALPELRQMVAELRLRQTQLMANRMAGAEQSMAQGQHAEGERAQRTASEAERMESERAARKGAATWIVFALFAFFAGLLAGRRLTRRPG